MPLTRRARALLIPAFLLSPSMALADLASGGDWTLIKSVHGEIGATLTGAGYSLTQSMGEPQIALAPLVTAGTTTLGGYLSQVPSVSTSGTSVSDTRSSSITLTLAGVTYGLKSEDSLVVAFNNEMSSPTLPGAITVTAIVNAFGQSVSDQIIPTLSYSATEQAAYMTAPGGWPKGSFIRVTISTDAKEINGVALTGFSTANFATARDFTASNVAIAPFDQTAYVSVPPNAFDGDYNIIMTTGIDNQAIRTANDTIAQNLGPERKPVKIARIDAYTGTMAPWPKPLQQPAMLSLPFQDLNNDGIVDLTSPRVRSKTLGVWRLEEDARLWVRQPGSEVNLAGGRVLLPTTHFSIYALIGANDTDVSLAYAFPVPFRPNAGNADRYGTWAQGVRFANMPSLGKIRIFTLSGELVRELDIDSSPQRWDVKNKFGEVVASGVYLWEVTSGVNRKTGKLMIIK